MGDKREISKFQKAATLVFLFLAAGLEALLAFYWLAMLEPQLMAKAKLTARALARSHVHAIREVLDKGQADPSAGPMAEDLEKAINRILLLVTPDTHVPFIRGVEVAADYDVVKAPEGALDPRRGRVSDDPFHIIEIPLYSSVTMELMGIARFHGNPEFFLNFKADVRATFFVGAIIGLVLLALAWALVNKLLGKINEAEREIQARRAQVIHAGRLTAIGEMATGIAHEINQPLAIIRLAADGLSAWFKRENPDSMEARASDKIIAQLIRATTIIDNMRSFARAGSDSHEPVNLIEPVTLAASFFKEQFRVHEIHLDLSLAEDCPRVEIDPQKFEQIVVNLLSNARHAVIGRGDETGDGRPKRVSVRLYHEEPAAQVVLEVEDNGVGMDPSVSKRCMEPFYTTKEVGEGTGLGLSIAHGIAREFNMDFQVKSEKGEGSLFRLTMKT
ncbi:MAG: hypothetical protein GY859_20855 [Desulfobacterales bacterium]|nr:hypothetical protein [Desulfobacterales bacterium]